MKMLTGGLMALSLFGVGLHEAAAVDKIGITSQRKPVAAVKGAVGEGGSRAKDSTTICYDLKLQNQTLADFAQLTVNYIVFVERPKLGARLDQPSPVDRISGTQNIDALTTRMPQTVTTSQITLNKSNLVGGWTYNNGGRIRAEDMVVGVWVRVLQNGETIAEYANPPTVTKRGWDTK